MNEAQANQLKDEQQLGNKAENAYNSFIKKYAEDKRVILFEAFQDASVLEPDNLITIKLQLKAIEGLDIEIKSIIDTGKMASKMLADATK